MMNKAIPFCRFTVSLTIYIGVTALPNTFFASTSKNLDTPSENAANDSNIY